jgi:predicted neuraminidase
VLAISPGGRLHLFYKVGLEVPGWRTRVMIWSDQGRTWSAPRELDPIEGFPAGPVKDKPIVLADGTWLAPTSRETASEWDAAVTRSVDDGRSWTLGGPVPIDRGSFSGKGVIQPTLWESAPGRVHMLLRSTCGCVCRSDSQDGGRTWSPVRPTGLPNNNSGIDVERLPDGTLALCCNPVGTDWGKRTPLVLLFSRDNGETWGGGLVLEDEDPPFDEAKVRLDRATRPNEFSYPAVVFGGPARDPALHVTYTWKRRSIAWRRAVPP